MKTNKTEEKKCEQVCRGIHILHGEHCQKEQPEQEVHDKLMNMALDHAKSAAHPPVLPSPPQELRQEAVINPFVGNIAELHKAIELLETMIPSDERKNLAKMYYTTATEMIEANRIQAYMEKIKQLQNMLDDASDEIKNVEQNGLMNNQRQQELRQGEWEKHVAPSPTLEKKLMCILGECPVSQENHLFEGFGEYCKFKGLTRVSEKFGELKILIKEIEQKAREEERKRVETIIDYYIKFAENLHKGAHEDNQNMIMYDAHSRIIACEHLKEQILNPKSHHE